MKWIIKHHGEDLLGEMIDHNDKYMFGETALWRLNLFKTAGLMQPRIASIQGKYDGGYVLEVVWQLLGEKAKYWRAK